MTRSPHVRILMCTYDGAAYLQPQLESFLAQSHGDWSLWISDDGSRDDTPAILRRFRSAHPRREIRLLRGLGKGATHNFLSLLARSPADGALVAFSDQDDIWLPDKLERALRALGAGQGPAVHAGARLLVDAELRVRGRSAPVRRPPSFRNALVQNILPGHSLMLTPAARSLVVAEGLPDTVRAHDWWIYLLVSGAGGRVIYDPEPLNLYRQHRGNLEGSNRGPAAALRRARQVWNRDFGTWMCGNLAALARARCLSPENRALVDRLTALDRGFGPYRAWRMWRCGLHRQTRFGTLVLLAAACMGRL